MRNSNLIALCFLVLLMAVPRAQAVSMDEASKRLPNTLGDFRAGSPPNAFEPDAAEKLKAFGVVVGRHAQISVYKW